MTNTMSIKLCKTGTSIASFRIGDEDEYVVLASEKDIPSRNIVVKDWQRAMDLAVRIATLRATVSLNKAWVMATEELCQ